MKEVKIIIAIVLMLASLTACVPSTTGNAVLGQSVILVRTYKVSGFGIGEYIDACKKLLQDASNYKIEVKDWAAGFLEDGAVRVTVKVDKLDLSWDVYPAKGQLFASDGSEDTDFVMDKVRTTQKKLPTLEDCKRSIIDHILR